VFWRKGYEGASLSDLTEAMGINRPSLYATFGDKRALFSKAVERYTQGPACYATDALAEPKARRAIERLLSQAVDRVTDPHGPRGCLLVQGALSSGDEGRVAREELAAKRAAGEAAIRKRLQRARAEGDLPPGADPADLARYVASLLQGLAVQAASGATRAALQRVVQLALRAWPA